MGRKEEKLIEISFAKGFNSWWQRTSCVLQASYVPLRKFLSAHVTLGMIRTSLHHKYQLASHVPARITWNRVRLKNSEKRMATG